MAVMGFKSPYLLAAPTGFLWGSTYESISTIVMVLVTIGTNG